jgi:hypothetical protein
VNERVIIATIPANIKLKSMYEVITTRNVMFQVNKGHTKSDMVYDINISEWASYYCLTPWYKWMSELLLFNTMI